MKVESNDEANFSERARLLSKARAKLNETPNLRTDRLANLRDQIEAGTYQAPIEALARKLREQLRTEAQHGSSTIGGR